MMRRVRAPARTHGEGFTLIEVLVALAVVAIALGALVTAGSRVLDHQAELEQRTLATWLADNRISEIRLDRAIAPGVTTGRLEYGGRRWRWRREVTPAPGDALWRIDVDVMQPDGTPVTTHTGFAPR